MPQHRISSGTKKKRLPRFPWWKDERVLGPITSSGAITSLIVAIVIGFGVLAWGGLKLVDLTDQLRDTQTTNHSNRLSDQRRTDQEIAQLQSDTRTTVCSIVALAPPGKSKAMDLLSKHYHCPPYKPSPTKATSSRSTQSSSVVPNSQTSTFGNGGTSTASPSLVPMPSVTAPPSLLPTATPTATHSATPTATPIIDLSSASCSLIGIFC